jgi:hypothetical protein
VVVDGRWLGSREDGILFVSESERGRVVCLSYSRRPSCLVLLFPPHLLTVVATPWSDTSSPSQDACDSGGGNYLCITGP